MYTACLLAIFSMLLEPIWASYAVPNYRLNDGRLIPGIGLGTWFGMKNLTHAAPVDTEAMEQAVGWAIDEGYRLIDTSIIYLTEGSIGRAVQTKIAEGVIKREDMFISTKLWNDAHARDAVVPALRMSLQALNLSYVDMYLIHFPVGQFGVERIASASEIFRLARDRTEYANLTANLHLLKKHYKKNAIKQNNGTYDLTDYVETWYGMIDAKRQGLARSIGVSNFNEHMIERIIKGSCVKLAVAQFEENLTIQLHSLLKYCCKNEIAVMGYSPFGSILNEKALPGAPPPRIDDPLIQQIAFGHSKTVSQIILRYLVDLGVIPIPKSVNKTHIKENINIFNFNLLPKERIVLSGYNVNYRTGKIWSDSPYYLTRQLFF